MFENTITLIWIQTTNFKLVENTFKRLQNSSSHNSGIALYTVPNDGGHWIDLDISHVLGHVLVSQELGAARVFVDNEEPTRNSIKAEERKNALS